MAERKTTPAQILKTVYIVRSENKKTDIFIKLFGNLHKIKIIKDFRNNPIIYKTSRFILMND